MLPDCRSYLWNAADACADVIRITAGVDAKRFWLERDLHHPAERYLEIVGEALRQYESCEPNAHDKVPAIRNWINLRNVIAHGYERIDYDILWNIGRNTVPDLKREIDALAGERPEST
jgi:uncharacterized protein with HEPN domain